MDENISRLISKFSQNAAKPELFLSIQSGVAGGFKEGTKHLYDLTKSEEDQQSDNALPELIIQGFDDEQIWQELELQNEPIVSHLLNGISRLSAKGSLSLIHDHTAPRQSKLKQSLEDPDQSDDSEEDSDQMDEEGSEAAGEEEGGSDIDDDIAAFLKGAHKDSYNSDESDEEKYLKDLLEKATTEQRDGNEDDSGMSEVDGDFEEGEKEDTGAEDEDLEELDQFFKDNTSQTLKKGRLKEDKTVKVFGKYGSVQNRNKQKSVVDDKFFNMADMEEFLMQEDRREERKIAAERGEIKRKGDGEGEESASDTEERVALDKLYGEASSESDGEEEIKYEDFFGPRSGSMIEDKEPNESGDESEGGEEEMMEEEEQGEKSLLEEAGGNEGGRNDLFGGSDSEGEDLEDVLGGVKSTYQKRQEKLATRIKGMEETALEQKPWQLTGETSAAGRPVNSLLEEDLEFEQQTKTAPAITEETTKSLEDIIKQRIKDKVFDDVERKDKPVEEAFEYKKRILLDQEKSKKSLGQVYEEEYLKQTEEEADEKEDPAREDIRKMMQSLFLKLDALSNFQYTPKQAAPEVQIVSNMPSISMEEVQPVSVSNTALLAPEEIKDKEKRELKGSTEKTKTDKVRERKDKKIRQRKKKLAKEHKQKVLEKIAPSLGNKYAKEKALKELERQSKMGKGVSVIKEKKSSKKSGLTSSKQFFTQLQEEVTTQVQAKKMGKPKKDKKRQSASKLKL